MRPASTERRPSSAVATAVVVLLALLAGLAAAARADAAPGDAAQRAYELVSPTDKHGADVTAIATAQAASDGDAITYISGGGFAGAPSNLLVGPYTAARGAAGTWSSRPLGLPQAPISQLQSASIVALSDDGTRSVQTSYAALAPGAVSDQLNLYLVDNATGARQLMATSGDPALEGSLTQGTQYQPFDGTPSFDHVVFALPGRLLPQAPASGTSVYEFTGGTLRLASVMPDGTAATNATIGTGGPRPQRQNAISDDGRRIFFQSNDTLGLYLREGGQTTEVAPIGTFGGATPDGATAYFSTFVEPGTGEGAGVFRYDTATGTRTSMTPGAPDFLSYDAPRMLAVDARGDYLWFTAQDALSPDATTGPLTLYVRHAGVTRAVAALDASLPRGAELSSVAVSPNGRYLAFQDYQQLTAAPTTSPACDPLFASGMPAGACEVVYVADGAAGGVTCASCPPAGERTLGHSMVNVAGNFRPSYGFYAARAVLDDGTTFFDTANALERRDVNGVTDVYQYRDGRAELVTTGTRPEPATFADAGADGRDLFFYTRAPLAGRDGGEDLDLYDARVGGVADTTVPPAPPRPCAGDACQGQPAPPPARQQPGTASFSGPTDPVPPAPKATKKKSTKKKSAKKKSTKKSATCRKGTRKVTSKGRTRCVKTTKKRAVRPAGRTQR